MVDTFYEKTGELMVKHSDYESLCAEGGRVRTGLEDLIQSCQAIIDNRHEDLGERDDVEPYLKNRLMLARKVLTSVSGSPKRDDDLELYRQALTEITTCESIQQAAIIANGALLKFAPITDDDMEWAKRAAADSRLCQHGAELGTFCAICPEGTAIVESGHDSNV